MGYTFSLGKHKEKEGISLGVYCNDSPIVWIQYTNDGGIIDILKLTKDRYPYSMASEFKRKYGVLPTEYLFGLIIKAGAREFRTGELTKYSQRMVARMVRRGFISHSVAQSGSTTRHDFGILSDAKFRATKLKFLKRNKRS
jgi:hypothetical protein